MHQLNRPYGDQLPPGAMQTYEIAAPISSHRRRATCAEVQCGAHTKGWTTTLPSDHAGVVYIRSGQSGRHFTESIDAPGQVTFHFPAGQEGFAGAEHDHTVPLEREPFYLLRQGDHRGYDGRPSVMREADWLDNFANHQDKIATLRGRG